jgi:hypothetical protein
LLPHHETQQYQNDQQLTYDRQALLSGAGGAHNIKPSPASSSSAIHASSSQKPLEKKVGEMEERQKIFEEEIIKRVKEIQNYAKTLHMHLKKLQQNQLKKGEELQAAKD